MLVRTTKASILRGVNFSGFFRIWGNLLLAIGFIAPAANGAVYYVNSTSPIGGNAQTWETAAKTIQDAIKAASPSDEIWVAAGVYFEEIFLHEGISLFGGFAGVETNRSDRNWNVHSTILDGGNTRRVANVSSASIPTRLDGFVIQNGRANFGAAIYSAGGKFISANNLIINNSSDGFFGGGGVFSDETVCFGEQSAIQFFTNIANRLLQLHSSGLTVDRIEIFPTNNYSKEIHRLLQLAANIYDATTNRGASYPFYPSVFRPTFANENGTIFISGYVEAHDEVFLTNPWLSLNSTEDRGLLSDPMINTNANLFGQPIIIGVKKGFPNFNEFSMETIAKVIRLIEIRKESTNLPPVFTQTNQMYRLQFTNIFGIEAWNSYTQIFSRPLELRVSHSFSASITDENGAVLWPTNGEPFSTNFVTPEIVVSNWPGVSPFSGMSNSFVLPYFTNLATLPLSQYFNSFPHFQPPATNFETNADFPIPKWILNVTNRIQYFAVDSGRVVDFVNLDGLNTKIDLNQSLLTPTSGEPIAISNMWRTNRLNGSIETNIPTLGIIAQINVSMGIPLLENFYWHSYNATPSPNIDLSISSFRKFMGFTPLSPYQGMPMPPYLTTIAPFSPTRTLYHRTSLQANDPLVHFEISDLQTHFFHDYRELIIPPSNTLPPSNMKKLNESCRPFNHLGISKYKSFIEHSGNPSFQDKEIGWSQDWDFPTNGCFNLQWLDKIHRGTPWQTIYTSFDLLWENPFQQWEWLKWSGNEEIQPTNDWKIVEMFLAERNNFGASHSSHPSIFANNTFAANNAVAGGAASLAANAIFQNNIIAGNSSGFSRLAVTNFVLIQKNSLFDNAQYNFANLPNVSENLEINPQFVDAKNFRLLATSPCIDAGSDSVFGSGWLLNEPARIQGSGIDLGAFELSETDAPFFSSPVFSTESNQFTFQVTGFSGQNYVVEKSTDLFHWLPISTNVTVNGFFTINETFGDFSNQFYRAVRIP